MCVCGCLGGWVGGWVAHPVGSDDRLDLQGMWPASYLCHTCLAACMAKLRSRSTLTRLLLPSSPPPLEQMVGGAFWPTTSGEPGHLMAFWNSTIRRVTGYCGQNETSFAVQALHQVGRWVGEWVDEWAWGRWRRRGARTRPLLLCRRCTRGARAGGGAGEEGSAGTKSVHLPTGRR